MNATTNSPAIALMEYWHSPDTGNTYRVLDFFAGWVMVARIRPNAKSDDTYWWAPECFESLERIGPTIA